MRRIALVALFFVCAGCLQGPTAFEFGGSFTEQATQADMEDFSRRMRLWGAQDVLILESHPAQFIVRGLDDNCEAARSEAHGLAYVRSVNACRETRSGGDGDPPTGTTLAT